MNATSSQLELRKRGLEALVRELGFADAMRFVHQFENGNGDYTKERTELLSGNSVDDLAAEADRILKARQK